MCTGSMPMWLHSCLKWCVQGARGSCMVISVRTPIGAALLSDVHRIARLAYALLAAAD